MSDFSSVWELRDWIGTRPSEDVKLETKFYRGVEDIFVDLVDYPANPYKAIFTIATATWGNVWRTRKWQETSPEARLYVVQAVLNRKSLPNAMESPSFTFEIAGPSRSSFDQIARARIGAVFGSMGWRDNCHSDIGFRVPEHVWRDQVELERFKESCLTAKYWYNSYLQTSQANWQDARAALPISALHRWSMAINYMALGNFMTKRLQFNEQADTVATAWLMRERVKEMFPLLASYLRPASDLARRCVEHVGDEMAQAFGCLFRCSGRWPCDLADETYTFNTSCTDRETLMNQSGLYIPEGTEDLPDPAMKFLDLTNSDQSLFMRN